MTVGELKKILAQYIDDMPVYLVENDTVLKSMDIKVSMILGLDDKQEDMEYFLIMQSIAKEVKEDGRL